MRMLAASLRFVAAAAGAAAIVVTLEDAVGRGAFQFLNFFGYFTIQGNVICVAVFLIAAIVGFSRREQGAALQWVRGAATTYIAIVGIVYNTLLVRADVDTPVPWANSVLHVIIPLYAVLDWLFLDDRRPQRWRAVWFVLIYPLVWTGATLARQAYEARPFIPYPFLNIGTLGGGVVALYVIGIAVAFVVVALGAWWASRARVLHVP